jgi:hypothetical protein
LLYLNDSTICQHVDYRRLHIYLLLKLAKAESLIEGTAIFSLGSDVALPNTNQILNVL